MKWYQEIEKQQFEEVAREQVNLRSWNPLTPARAT